jgi:hypothetical protein
MTVSKGIVSWRWSPLRRQEMLHARIVEHLEDPDLGKIASPGLIVRRIDANVIREVLAGPCDLDLSSRSAESLFDLLRDEVSLVEPVDFETVRHRPDVRAIMLSSLRRDLGPLAREIDDLAVDFWSKRSSPAERAEEIYHRLWRSDSDAELEQRWMPEAGRFLEDALDEFSTTRPGDWAYIWLAQHLGRELPRELRLNASQVAWERDTQRKVRTLLADGKTQECLRVLAERPHVRWLSDSALWGLEVETLLLSGDFKHAEAIVDLGLSRAGEAHDAQPALELLARRVRVFEREGRDLDAIRAAREALDVARATRKYRPKSRDHAL